MLGCAHVEQKRKITLIITKHCKSNPAFINIENDIIHFQVGPSVEAMIRVTFNFKQLLQYTWYKTSSELVP